MTVIAERVNGSVIVFVNLQIVRRQRYLGHHGFRVWTECAWNFLSNVFCFTPFTDTYLNRERPPMQLGARCRAGWRRGHYTGFRPFTGGVSVPWPRLIGHWYGMVWYGMVWYGTPLVYRANRGPGWCLVLLLSGAPIFAGSLACNGYNAACHLKLHTWTRASAKGRAIFANIVRFYDCNRTGFDLFLAIKECYWNTSKLVFLCRLFAPFGPC